MEASDLPSEEKIMARWKGINYGPVVSVICCTYNHEKYIEDAIKGFLIQRTSFPFEIIIHDDNSTDTTPSIIKSYCDRYPNIIKAVFQLENQYSKGKKPTLLALPYANSNFIALCEGDDFWFYENKLEAQKYLLDTVPEISMCSHPSPKVNVSGVIKGCFLKNESRKIINPDEVIRRGGGWCATSSVMVRRNVLQQFSEKLSGAPVGDLFIQLLGAVNGGVCFITTPSSVYRMNVPGSWNTTRRELKVKEHLAHYSRMLSSLSALSELSCFAEFQKPLKGLRSKATYSLGLSLLKKREFNMFARVMLSSFKQKPFLSLRQSVLTGLAIPIYIITIFK